jgi:PAS domain-containing protein
VLIALQGSTAQRLEIWAILTMLLTAMAAVSPALPLATVLLCGVVGAISFGQFMLIGMFDIGLAAVGMTAMLAFGAIQGARNFLASRVAEAAMAEKSEVVSLLLREFEEGEADWLWQIDTARRVRSISPRFAFALGLDPEQIDGKPFIQMIARKHGILASSLLAFTNLPNA